MSKVRTKNVISSIACGSLLGAGAFFAAPQPNTAYGAMLFDAGNIISDFSMYNSSTMTKDEVESFIKEKGANCVAEGNNICLKDYRETTSTRPPNDFCQKEFGGSQNNSAAGIIYKAAKACGINPQVLLVTLQKEQGLITAPKGKPAGTYERALGFGCPDSLNGGCLPQYSGFANQVYSAASRLQQYRINAGSFNYRVGETVQIKFHPKSECGTGEVTIKNQATAGLYNYTPYQPNDAALNANIGALGDECSSYGNKNFSYYFNLWFGDPHYKGSPAKVEGDAAVGSTLTAHPGTWMPATALFYQWLADGFPIEGATSETYQAAPEDQGKRISVQVTGAKSGFPLQSKKSQALLIDRTVFNVAAQPKIVGVLRVGEKLKVNTGEWTPEPTDFTYQWFADGQKINGATKDHYIPSQKMLGKQISVKVLASRPGFNSLLVASNRTSPIKAAAGG
ncbi:MAG: hypothetical protein LBB58_01825 [Cellulomonadaceae bacterium]|jgi:hypothetical protein|nr:hypothetical protein [Cellulomonadaceae bacterium]